MYVYLVEANFCYLFGCILNPEDCFCHKYNRAILWEAKFKVVYHTHYAFIIPVFAYLFLGIVFNT